MGDGANQFSVLDDGAAGHALDDAACGGKKCRIGDANEHIPSVLPVGGSDSPPDCHSLPPTALRLPFTQGGLSGRLSTARFLLPILPPCDMIKEKAVNNMIEKDDWRLTAGPVLGNEEKLKNIPLYYIPFPPLSENWDHEHCTFCWAKFYLHEECLQEGYCTRPQNCRDADWICPECYEDFKEMFGWTLKRGDTE